MSQTRSTNSKGGVLKQKSTRTQSVTPSPKRRRIPLWKEPCSPGPMDKFVIRSPKPCRRRLEMKESDESNYGDENVINEKSGNSQNIIASQNTKGPIGPKNNNQFITSGDTRMNIPPAVIRTSFSKFNKLKAKQDEFSQIPNFYTSSQDNHKTLLVEELPKPLTDVFFSYFEQDELPSSAVISSIQFLHSVVSNRYYPPPKCLSHIIFNIMMDCTNLFVFKEAYSLVYKIFTCHPPSSPQMQEFYRQALCGGKSLENINSKCGWENILKVLDCSDLVTSEEKRNRAFILKFIVHLLQSDLRACLTRESSDLKVEDEIPLVAQLAWPNRRIDYINDNIMKLIRSIACGFSSSRVADQLSHGCFLFISVLGECCQWKDQCKSFKQSSSLLPSLGPMMKAFANCIAEEIIEIFRNHRILHEFLKGLTLPWLRLLVSQYLLVRMSGNYFTDAGKSSSLDNFSYKNYKSVFGSRVNKPNNVSLNQLNSKEKNLSLQLEKASTADRVSSSRLKSTSLQWANKRNLKGETPLHLACAKNEVVRVRNLLAIPGININAKDNDGWTPLHEACNRNNFQVVWELLRHPSKKNLRHRISTGGVDLEAQAGPDGINPFHDAVIGNNLETVQILLENVGSRLLTMTTGKGKSVRDLIQSKEMKTLIKKFESVRDEEQSSTSSTISESRQSFNSVCSLPPRMASATYLVVVFYHGICAYLEIHRIFSLWKLITQEMKTPSKKEFPLMDQQSFDINTGEVQHLCNDIKHLYNLERNLQGMKSHFSKDDENDTLLKFLVLHLTRLSRHVRLNGNS